MTRIEIADSLGCDNGTLSKWVHADGVKKLPSGPLAVAFYRLLEDRGVNVRWVITGEGTERVRETDEAAERLAAVRAVLDAPIQVLRGDGGHESPELKAIEYKEIAFPEEAPERAEEA